MQVENSLKPASGLVSIPTQLTDKGTQPPDQNLLPHLGENVVGPGNSLDFIQNEIGFIYLSIYFSFWPRLWHSEVPRAKVRTCTTMMT